MKYNFQFSNLCGAVYKKGNVIFLENGDCLLSPVGNRLSKFDLKNNESSTFGFENQKDIHRCALSPNEQLLVAVDADGRALLVNIARNVVLHHFHFKSKVYDIKFSPDGKYIAVTHDKIVQIWRSPGTHKEFAPFDLYRKFPAQYDSSRCIDWSDDSRFFAVGSRDMSCRVYSLAPLKGFRYVNLLGHRSPLVNCSFTHKSLDLYTISKDGAVVVWKSSMSLDAVKDLVRPTSRIEKRGEDMETDAADKGKGEELDSDDEAGLDNEGPGLEDEGAEDVIGEDGSDDDDTAGLFPSSTKKPRPSNAITWTKSVKYLFSQGGARVSCSAHHKSSGILVTGFTNGVFTLHEMPDFTPIHSLSISEHSISSVTINKSGEWLAFGSSSLGQLLVWEWQSESYVLKQQGHFFDMNAMCYGPDGRILATGGDDGKVKLWNTSSGFCFVTFSDHTSPVTAVTFAPSGKVVLSGSLDGTVRAYDLHRYRNFRTFASPRPAQFTCLSLDPSGEILAAGSHDTFEIFVWSMQTGRLLEILTGHEGPISGVSFSPSKPILASSSWDCSVRLWDVFESKGNTDTMRFTSMAVSLTFRPDGQQLAVATLDGNISFWDTKSSLQTGCIEGRRDLEMGRRFEDKVTAKTLSGAAHFTTLCYSADGGCVLAGGRSKFVCLYEVEHQVLLNRFQTSSNASFDGAKRFLGSDRLTEAGPLELISDEEFDSDNEGRKGISLPGVRKGDYSSRKSRPEIRTKCLQFSPTGRAWSAVTTEGLLVFTLDNKISFDPFNLSSDVTPDTIREAIKSRSYSMALGLSLRLNEYPLIIEALESIPMKEIELVLRDFPDSYVERLIPVLADRVAHSPHLQYYLHWCTTLLTLHTRSLKEKGMNTQSLLTNLQKSIIQKQLEIGKLCDSNSYGLQYALTVARMPSLDTSIHSAAAVDCT